MAASSRLCALVALAVATGAAGNTPTVPTNPFARTADDNRAITEADRARQEQCADVDLASVDKADGRKALIDYMGSSENVILKVLRQSSDPSQFGDKAKEEITPAWLIRTAGSLIFSFILLAVWLICCWTAFPCCACCRCCKKQRRTGKIMKIVLLVFLGCLLFGMFVSAMVAVKGRTEIVGGMDSIACTSAKTMYHTLAGKMSQQYIGILPMMESLGVVRDSLLDNSGLMTDVQNIVSQTGELERAQYVATQAMLLLEATLRLPENKNNPVTQPAIDALLGPISQVNSALSGGMGSALSSARAEVDNQLSSANRNTLRSAMDSALAPLRSVADTVRDSLWFFIKEDFKNLKDMAVKATSGGVIGIACVIFLIASCGICSGLLCTFRDYSEAREKLGQNPWNSHVSNCALTTWCCGFLYGFLVFFFGGIMIVCAVPMASVCLVLDDINSQMIREIMPALGASVQGNSFNMVADVIDNCFSRSSSTDRSLMEIVYFEENGNRTTLQQKLSDQLVGQINQQFTSINQQLAQNTTVLATQPGVTQLKSALQSFAWPSSAPPAVGFRCDIYQTGLLGSDCDVKNMVKSPGGTWGPDCVTGTNPLSVRRKTKTCTSAQFVTYVNEWATRIQQTFSRVDDAVTVTGSKISTDLQAAVKQYVTDPIDNIASNAHCSFLKTEYQDFVTGFCFQGVVGFGLAARAYVANGVLCLLLIITAYIVWRVSSDNHLSFQDEVRPMQAGREVVIEMKGAAVAGRKEG